MQPTPIHTTNGDLLRAWWQTRPPAARRRWRIVLLLFAIIWLSGAVYAPRVVVGLARLDGAARWLMALAMGGFGWLWSGLKQLGLITESADAPHLLWIPLALALPTAVYGLTVLLSRQPDPAQRLQQMTDRLEVTQGRATEAALAAALAIEQGIPFVQVRDRRQQPVSVGLDYARGEGHVLVTAPTRAGKGLHLTETLLNWPGAALVVDPKGEQLERTAAVRSVLGPIYRLPGHALPLADYYGRLLDRDDVAELHSHLLRPWESREPIFADKARSLFTAAGLYAQAHGLDPLRVLLDLAESDPAVALRALEQLPAVKRHVRVFTNGAPPDAYREDKFVTSAFGNLTTRLAGYQQHIDTIAPPADRPQVPADWVARGGTLYITYSLQDLRGVGGVVAAVIAAIVRAQLRSQLQPDRRANRPTRLLVAIDELPAVGLKNIADYLATSGGAGITLLLYVQSLAQLHSLYGQDDARAILANCAHQLWYPPAEPQTAELMSQLLGVTLQARPVQSSSAGSRQQQERDGQLRRQTHSQHGASWSWQEHPLLLPSQVLGLAKEQVLVSTLSNRRYVFLGQRLNPLALFDRLPSATRLHLPEPATTERVYTDWNQPAATRATADDSATLEATDALQGSADASRQSPQSAELPPALPETGAHPVTDRPAAQPPAPPPIENLIG